MKQVQNHESKNAATGFRAFIQQIFPVRANRRSAAHKAINSARGWREKEHSENRYSVVYLLNDQYQHVGCATQEDAQSVQGLMLTDGNRVPVGIYDSKTDSFEWEIVGEYLTSRSPEARQNDRHERILTIARALRRRDASWHPGYLQRPSFFA